MNNYDPKYGYSKESFEMLYDDVYSELLDLENEFEEFYSKEYENFNNFLSRKFNMTKADIKEIKKLKDGNTCRRVFIKANSYSDSLGLQAIALSKPLKTEIIELFM